VASALAEIHVKAGMAAGMTAYYVELVCRSAAISCGGEETGPF
jgi:hypothetical protein